jgi:hypothetical protein
MNIAIEKKKIDLIPNSYGGNKGSLGVLISVTIPTGKFAYQWYGCREEFAQCCKSQYNGFLFSHPDKTTEDIAEFVERFEILMEQGRRRPIHRSEFAKITTQGARKDDHTITWVAPGPFWLKQDMRHQLLTVLLRCALWGYTARKEEDPTTGDFFQALYNSYKYATTTRTAISRFLDGHTWYTGDASGGAQGWIHAFGKHESITPVVVGSTSGDAFLKLLIKPKKKEPKPADQAPPPDR